VTSLVETDYVLFLSCSEFIPTSLLERFDEVATARSADAISCVRRSYTCGELFPELWGPAPRVGRFYNRHEIDFDGNVIHGLTTCLRKDRLLDLPAEERFAISHLRDTDAASLMTKHTAYAQVEAVHRASRGERVGWRWLVSSLAGAGLLFVRVLLSGANRIALREVWAQAVMHTITYWVAWERRHGRTMEYSQARSEQVWRDLVGAKDRPEPGSARPKGNVSTQDA
jgi:hypothetical protein